MQPKYFTERDASLTHQVVLFTQTGGSDVVVSCNCRLVRANAQLCYDPIGKTRNLDESRALYNDPKNHFKKFTEADKAKW